MLLDEFDYHLPDGLIAQYPAKKRDDSRLMFVDRATGKIQHKRFYDILSFLNRGDCLVLNDSKVLPARLFGLKEKSGAKIEFLLLKRVCGDVWEIMARPGKKLHPGDIARFTENGDFAAEIISCGEEGTRVVKFTYEGVFLERIKDLGKIPLPPYIGRDAEESDKIRYQTVYARSDGSVAAPTAGLHFTELLLEKAEKTGVRIARVTLHVGPGTFRPVKCERVEEHTMHAEEYEISGESADAINETVRRGGRIVSVGTTSVRALESAAAFDRETGKYLVKPGGGSTDIFIRPGYEFKMAGALITNFHLPKSTLLMLASAFYEREKILEAYETAIRMGYRFFSYGDAMFIL